MDGKSISFARSATGGISQQSLGATERVIEFYEEAGCDYEHWSRGLNMHLGYYRRGMNPFRREAMLEQMNVEVAGRLRIDPAGASLLIDLGCGMGSIARSIARHYSNSMIKGVTIVPSHVNIASVLNAQAKLSNRIEILQGNYLGVPVPDRSADGVWAV